MAYSRVTKAEIDAVLALPTDANALMKRFIDQMDSSSVLSPEDFGAPVISNENLFAHRSATTEAADHGPVQECLDRITAQGGTMLARRRYGTPTGWTMPSHRREATDFNSRDYHRIIGWNASACGLETSQANVNVLTLQGTEVSGGALPIHPSFSDLCFTTPAAGTGKGIVSQNNLAGNDTRISNSVFERLYLDTAADGIFLGDTFQATFDHVKGRSQRGHVIMSEGGNATFFKSCYASRCGEGKAGFRCVYFGGFLRCTGLDESPDNCAGMIMVGGRAAITGTCRTGGSTTIFRLDAGDGGYTGEYNGLELWITAGTHDGFKGTIARHVRGDATHGNYVQLSADTPLPATIAAAVAYTVRDAESQYRNNGTSINRLFRGTVEGCNFEIVPGTGLRATYKASIAVRDNLFYNLSTDHDCGIYLWGPDRALADISATVSLEGNIFDTSGTRRYPAEIVQARGTTPAAMAVRHGTGFRTIYSMEDASALRMYHTDGLSIQMPSGLATANPGAGLLWNDGGTLKVGT